MGKTNENKRKKLKKGSSIKAPPFPNFITKFALYTDGSCTKNPGGYGGWAYLLVNQETNEILKKNSCCSFEPTTSNRMEIQAVIEGLKCVSSLPEIMEIIVYSDSTYVVNSCSTWIKFWSKNDWKMKNKKPVKNKDLMKILETLISKKNYHFQWIKGHSGIKFHEEVDKRAKEEAEYKQAEIDANAEVS